MNDKISIRSDDSEEWQLSEIQAGVCELDAGQGVSHEKVSQWLSSWGTREEPEAAR
jgi:predicted transcriptional regulator